jgi:general secretion pathway protein J
VNPGHAYEVADAQASDERWNAGFTLVELLAAIALLSLLSVILVGSLQLGFRAWERGAAHETRVGHVALAQNFLRRAIEDAYPFFVINPAQQGHVAFDGAVDSLRLLASTSRALGKGGRTWWSLAVNRDLNRTDLVIVAMPEHAGDQDKVSKILLPNIQRVELSYFGKTRTEREPGWRPQWAKEWQLPKLVRIRVWFPPGDNRIWPELVIAPRIAADVGCVYDPLTKQCRGR